MEKVEETKKQLIEIVSSYNGYNVETILIGVQTRLKMTEQINHPVTGKITPEEAERLLYIASKCMS